MVPSAFVFLEALPLTANGKLDRKALPAPEGDAYARGSYEAPLGEVEAALAGIWAEVLGVEQVGRWDHFFELGGHSLLAIRLIERMRRVGLYMEVQALFTTPVLADLALTVGGASSEVEVPANGIPEGCGSLTPEMLPLVELGQAEIDLIVAGVPGGAANVQDIYPLTHLQEGFLFHHLLSQEGDPYLLSSVTEFDTRARLEQYLAALQAVIDRHDILRTAVLWNDLPSPVQVVHRRAKLPDGETVDAFLDRKVDVAAEAAKLTTPAAKDAVFQAAIGMAKIDGTTKESEQKVLTQMRAAFGGERARVNATRAIRKTLRRIEAHDARLGRQLARSIRLRFPGRMLSVEAHTDDRGTPERNQRLASRRARCRPGCRTGSSRTGS